MTKSRIFIRGSVSNLDPTYACVAHDGNQGKYAMIELTNGRVSDRQVFDQWDVEKMETYMKDDTFRGTIEVDTRKDDDLLPLNVPEGAIPADLDTFRRSKSDAELSVLSELTSATYNLLNQNEEEIGYTFRGISKDVGNLQVAHTTKEGNGFVEHRAGFRDSLGRVSDLTRIIPKTNDWEERLQRAYRGCDAVTRRLKPGVSIGTLNDVFMRYMDPDEDVVYGNIVHHTGFEGYERLPLEKVQENDFLTIGTVIGDGEETAILFRSSVPIVAEKNYRGSVPTYRSARGLFSRFASGGQPAGDKPKPPSQKPSEADMGSSFGDALGIPAPDAHAEESFETPPKFQKRLPGTKAKLSVRAKTPSLTPLMTPGKETEIVKDLKETITNNAQFRAAVDRFHNHTEKLAQLFDDININKDVPLTTFESDEHFTTIQPQIKTWLEDDVNSAINSHGIRKWSPSAEGPTGSEFIIEGVNSFHDAMLQLVEINEVVTSKIRADQQSFPDVNMDNTKQALFVFNVAIQFVQESLKELSHKEGTNMMDLFEKTLALITHIQKVRKANQQTIFFPLSLHAASFRQLRDFIRKHKELGHEEWVSAYWPSLFMMNSIANITEAKAVEVGREASIESVQKIANVLFAPSEGESQATQAAKSAMQQKIQGTTLDGALGEIKDYIVRLEIDLAEREQLLEKKQTLAKQITKQYDDQRAQNRTLLAQMNELLQSNEPVNADALEKMTSLLETSSTQADAEIENVRREEQADGDGLPDVNPEATSRARANEALRDMVTRSSTGAMVQVRMGPDTAAKLGADAE